MVYGFTWSPVFMNGNCLWSVYCPTTAKCNTHIVVAAFCLHMAVLLHALFHACIKAAHHNADGFILHLFISFQFLIHITLSVASCFIKCTRKYKGKNCISKECSFDLHQQTHTVWWLCSEWISVQWKTWTCVWDIVAFAVLWGYEGLLNMYIVLRNVLEH